MVARSCGKHEIAIANRFLKCVVKHYAVQNSISARGHHARLFVRPALQRLHQPQPWQAEICHRSGSRTDVLTELRFDQNDNWRGCFDPALGFIGARTRHTHHRIERISIMFAYDIGPFGLEGCVANVLKQFRHRYIYTWLKPLYQ